MVEYKRRNIPITTIINFRKEWDKCMSLDEKDELRDKFFDLDFNEELLEVGWDKVVLGEECYPLFPKKFRDYKSKLAGKLPEDELTKFRKCGYSMKELSQIFKRNPQIIMEALQQLGLNKNSRSLKMKYYFLGKVEA